MVLALDSRVIKCSVVSGQFSLSVPVGRELTGFTGGGGGGLAPDLESL